MASRRLRHHTACVLGESALSANSVSSTVQDDTPVIVGVSRFTPKGLSAEQGLPASPLDLMERTAREAARDTGIDEAAVLREVSVVGCAGIFSPEVFPMYPNLPRSLANRLGVRSDAVCHQRGEGGDGAQAMTNIMAARIASHAPGSDGITLLARGLAVDSLRVWKQKHPGQIKELHQAWADDPGAGEPERSGVPPQPNFITEQEYVHDLIMPIQLYPLIENALRHKYGKSFKEHHESVSQLMSSFSRVAAGQPDHAWRPVFRTPEEIAVASASNRWVGFPYTKYMNANDNIDGAATWLLCSVKTARRLGIRKDKWVYLYAGAQCHEGTDDKWFLSGRNDITQLPSLQLTISHCLSAAGVSSQQISFFDLYSCFPCVVEIAADILGVPHDDPRGLTITGGLPFYGQMSSTCCIPAMVERLRVHRAALGLVTGNGGLATKHSAGLYSGEPPKQLFQLAPVEQLQAEVDAMPSARLAQMPAGEAVIETFTVHHGKDNKPRKGVIFGRLVATGERFLANVANDPAVYARMMHEEVIGQAGHVIPGGQGKPNQFVFH